MEKKRKGGRTPTRGASQACKNKVCLSGITLKKKGDQTHLSKREDHTGAGKFQKGGSTHSLVEGQDYEKKKRPCLAMAIIPEGGSSNTPDGGKGKSRRRTPGGKNRGCSPRETPLGNLARSGVAWRGRERGGLGAAQRVSGKQPLSIPTSRGGKGAMRGGKIVLSIGTKNGTYLSGKK